MRALLIRIAKRLAARDRWITWDEVTGEVCTVSCRAAAHRDRVFEAAYRARL